MQTVISLTVLLCCEHNPVPAAVLATPSILIRFVVLVHSTVHNDMARSVFGAPVSWFDSTPLGRIFNRFSSDIITLDKDLMNDVSSYSDMVRFCANCVLRFLCV